MNTGDMAAKTELIAALWRLRTAPGEMAAPELTVDEGFEVLLQLVCRAMDSGDDVIGWKIGRLPGGETSADDVVFAAPVFASSLKKDRFGLLSAPRIEIEFVGTITESQLGTGDPGSWDMSWRLGLEVIDNHDSGWSVSPGWAIADWGLHGAAVLGDVCRAPKRDAKLAIQVVEGLESNDYEGAWRSELDEITAVLRRDSARLKRQCAPGDLVWTGAILPPMPMPRAGVHLGITVSEFGEVSFAA